MGYQRRLHGIIKIIFCRTILLFLPIPIIVVVISLLILILSAYNFNLILGCYRFLREPYDLISKSLVILTIWIIVLIIIAQKNVEYKKRLVIRLAITFSTIRIIIFYFFFEWSLIPIFFIIIGWGYQPERLKASLALFFYTLFASLPLLISIILTVN